MQCLGWKGACTLFGRTSTVRRFSSDQEMSSVSSQGPEGGQSDCFFSLIKTFFPLLSVKCSLHTFTTYACRYMCSYIRHTIYVGTHVFIQHTVYACIYAYSFWLDTHIYTYTPFSYSGSTDLLDDTHTL